MIPDDVNVFPLNTDNVTLTDIKQYLAAQKSLLMLNRELEDSSEYGAGYKRLLQQRVTETQLIIAKLEEKYGKV